MNQPGERMKSLLLLLAVSTSAMAGTEIVYERAQSTGDFGLKAKISVYKNEAKLGLTRRATGCGFGGVCNFQEKVSVDGLSFNKQNETVSYKNTLCGTTRVVFLNHSGRTGKYITKFSSNGNCELSVEKSNNVYQVKLTH
jgi:hypothetical protein